MSNEIDLTAPELSALASVDGTHTQPAIPPDVASRLRDLSLIERREWPDGPLWRTASGNRRVRRGS